MTKRLRRTHAPAFKAKVALAAIKGEKTQPNWCSSMMCTRTTSPPGRGSWLRRLQGCLARAARPLSQGPIGQSGHAGGKVNERLASLNKILKERP
jgi:hypothetical protein